MLARSTLSVPVPVPYAFPSRDLRRWKLGSQIGEDGEWEGNVQGGAGLARSEDAR